MEAKYEIQNDNRQSLKLRLHCPGQVSLSITFCTYKGPLAIIYTLVDLQSTLP